MVEVDKNKLRDATKRARDEGWDQWIRPCRADELALISGHYFDPNAVEYVASFLRNYIKHTREPWKGQPFELLDFQYRDIIGPLYGWRKADGRRRFTQGMITLAKKNGKTCLAASLVLLHLVGLDEPRAVVRSAATTRKQAAYIYEEAAAMVKESPELLELLGRNACIDSTKTISYKDTLSNYQALSADADSADGLSCSLVIFDELHRCRNRKLFTALRRAGRSRREPLNLTITTAGDSKESIAYQEYQTARKVIDGVVQLDHFFAYIAEAPKDADISLPVTWRLANPGLGTMFDEEEIRQDFLLAQQSVQEELEFRRFTLNQWVSGSNKWLPWQAWDSCPSKIDLASLEGRICIGGLDVGLVNDLTAFVLVFPPTEEGGQYVVLAWFWLPEDIIDDLEREHSVGYRAWESKDHIEFTHGNAVDTTLVRRRINELAKKYQIREIGYDRRFAEHMAQQMQDEDGLVMTPLSCSPRELNEASRIFEGLVLDCKLNHGGNPILGWMASNVCVHKDANENIAPCKPTKDSPEKVDGIVATVIALTCLVGNPDISPQESVYEKEDAGVFWL